MGLNEDPTKAAPADIATATRESNPSRRVRMSRTGMSAIISSCIFSKAPAVAKKIEITGMTSISRRPSIPTSQLTASRNAPVISTTVNAPPMRKTRNTTSAASAKPLGMATMA